MANREHLKRLEEGRDSWDLFRIIYPEIKPDLSHADLSSANLAQMDFYGTDFRKADLSKTNLKRADLCMANLSGAILDFTRLDGANLCGADLTETRLHHTKLCGADLQNANLTNAILSHVDFSGANAKAASFTLAVFRGGSCRQADFSGASLVGAILDGMFMGGAKLEDTFVGQTAFLGIKLGRIQGLASAHHMFKSSVSLDCLYESKGRLGDNFLRACGVPEDFLNLCIDYFGREVQYYSCFISYSHADREFAHKLYERLRRTLGLDCWLDEKDMKPGERILDGIKEAIRGRDKVVLCCSEESLESWWVKDEIRKALERERLDGQDIVIPLMLDGYLLNGWDDGLATDLRSRLAADFSGWEHDNRIFEEQVKGVVKALRTDNGRQEKMPTESE